MAGSTTPRSGDGAGTSTREQAAEALSGAAEQARTPLLAALGAGDLAARTVLDAVHKVRTEINERTESARSGTGDLPGDLNELRERLDPAELRKQVDQCAKSAVELYGYLADRGQDALGRLQAQPPVDRARSQAGTAQGRAAEAVGEVRDLADDVLGKVSRSTRSFGEKAARATEDAAGEAARAVQDAADEAADTVRDAGTRTASETRSTARKAANRTESAQGSGSSRTSTSKNASGKGASGKSSGSTGKSSGSTGERSDDS